MSVQAWLMFCATEVVLCLTPGPAVLFVASMALARGRRAGVVGAFGILAANALYFALSATGVAATIVASSEIFRVVKLAGAAYLVALGLRAVFAAPDAPAAARHEPGARSLGRGFVVQASNPKALVFFVALLPQFIDPEGDVFAQILLLGASSLAIELAVLSAYAVLADRVRTAAGARFGTALQRAGGVMLVAAGARLARVGAQSRGP